MALALTKDFVSFEQRGPIMPPEDKDAAFFPRTFGDRWVLIHRPVPSSPGSKANIWLSYSPDLKHYGDHMVLLEARDGAYWDAGKIGLSPPPIETAEGWLIIYHGVRHTPAGAIYRLGLPFLRWMTPGCPAEGGGVGLRPGGAVRVDGRRAGCRLSLRDCAGRDQR